MTYTTDQKLHKGLAVVQRGTEVLAQIETKPNLPHNYVLWVDFDGEDAWLGTSKGLGRAIGKGYYAGLRRGKKGGGEGGECSS